MTMTSTGRGQRRIGRRPAGPEAGRLVVGALFALSAVLGAAAAHAAEVTGPSSALPFIDDDYARARAEARARNLPLFVEAWAPW